VENCSESVEQGEKWVELLSVGVEGAGVEQEKLTVENEAVERLAEEGFSLGKQKVRRTE
jgi:hypothetical protein